MLKNKIFAAIMLVTFLCESCTKTLYTQDEVMSRYRTKNDVIARFGLPSNKSSEGTVTQFYYDYGNVSVSSGYGRSNTNASVYGTYNGVSGNSNTNAFGIAQTTNYTKYVKFVFDNNDNVINWETYGINMAEKTPATGKTILLITTTLVLSVGLGILAGSGD